MVLYLSVENVSKRFGSVQAVDGISFSCEEGELVAILGPSGCGKTTLLRMVAGFESPDSGEIHLLGQSIVNLAPENRKVGMLFQNYALFPHLTVNQNIAYGLKFLPNTSKQRIADEVAHLLDLVDLPGYGERRPDQLSAGQQQRIAIARALAPRPRLLLLDEPLSALDVALRDQLRLNIRRIQRELNLTTLYVTHDQEEAMTIADRILVMRDGMIEQFGSPAEVYERPATAFVASFFGRTTLLSTEDLPPNLNWKSGSVASGKAVLRAERVHPEAPGTPLHGTLLEVEYLGHMVRLLVEGKFGTVWATAPGTDINHWLARRNEPVTVHFRPEVTPVVPNPNEKI